MILVLAGSHVEAVNHLRDRGIDIHVADTWLVDSRTRLDGLRLTSKDKILFCRTFSGRADALEILRTLQQLAALGNFKLADIWEDIPC